MSDDLKLFTPYNKLIIIFPFNALPFLAYIKRTNSLIQGIIKKKKLQNHH